MTPSPRLERPLAGRKVAGVCAGIARHQRIDPLFVRIAAVALILFGGLGFIAYFVGLLLIPGEGRPEPIIREGADGPERNKVILLGVVAGIALFSFGIGPFGWFDGPGGFWIALAAVGAVAFVVMRRDNDDLPASGVTPALTGDEHTAQTAVIQPRAGRTGRSLAILGGALIALAATAGVFAAVGGDIRWDVALCVGVIVMGVALVASAPFGGARILAPFGVILALFAGGAAAADLSLRGGAGDRLERPVGLPAGTTAYNLAAGRLMIDLRDVNLPPGVSTVKAELGFGQIVVRVPDDVRVELKAHASAGDVELLGRDSNGLDAKRSTVLTPVASGVGTTLRIDAHTGFGQIRVIGADHALPDRHSNRFHDDDDDNEEDS